MTPDPVSVLLSRTVDASTLTDPFLIVTLVAAACYLIQLAYFAFITRAPDVDAGPPTSDLTSESPALVNLLVNEARVTGAAVPATLLDLAVRDLVDIEEYGDAEEIIVRLREHRSAEGLAGYSLMVLEHLRAKAANGIVRAEALTLGPEGTSKSWMERFKKLLHEEAKALGLTRPRWEGAMWRSLTVTGLLACLFLLALLTRYVDFWFGLFFAGLAVFVGNAAVVKYFSQPQLNQTGVSSASRWLGVRRFLEDNDTFNNATPGAVALWDSYMSYGAAMGLANDALRHLPMGEEDDEDAWSAYSGEWRHVRVAYPRLRVIWGKSPLRAIWTGMIMTALGAGIVYVGQYVHSSARTTLENEQDIADWIRLGALIAIGVAAPLILWGVHTMFIGFLDLFSRRVVTGQVIRLRSWVNSKSGRWYMALYDGRESKIRAWRVGPGTYARLNQGDVIEATFTPRTGHVKSFSYKQKDASPAPAVGTEAGAT